MFNLGAARSGSYDIFEPRGTESIYVPYDILGLGGMEKEGVFGVKIVFGGWVPGARTVEEFILITLTGRKWDIDEEY